MLDHYISVVVPFHNEEKHIEQRLWPPISQDYPSSRCEIVMVDNGSTDGSPDIVKQICKGTRRRFTAEDKIQIVLEGLRGKIQTSTF